MKPHIQIGCVVLLVVSACHSNTSAPPKPDPTPVASMHIEADRDGDDFIDAYDTCPDESEDFDLFEDDDGCPDHDHDFDGVADTIDLCRDEPEDIDKFQDNDGCPDNDFDGDGILDADDPKPHCRHDFGGGYDHNKCPVVRIGTPSKKHILYFVSGGYSLNQKHKKELVEIANVLEQNPSIKRIHIEGYTDSQGGSRANLDNGMKRAEAARDFIVRQGIDPRRVLPVSYGEQFLACKISASSTTSKKHGERCRAKNRRVEFRIIKINGEEYPPRWDVPPPLTEKK